jgi:hypothetical protein
MLMPSLRARALIPTTERSGTRAAIYLAVQNGANSRSRRSSQGVQWRGIRLYLLPSRPVCFTDFAGLPMFFQRLLCLSKSLWVAGIESVHVVLQQPLLLGTMVNLFSHSLTRSDDPPTACPADASPRPTCPEDGQARSRPPPQTHYLIKGAVVQWIRGHVQVVNERYVICEVGVRFGLQWSLVGRP